MIEEDGPFMQGVKAYFAYEARDSNPYSIDHFNHFVWSQGYNEAKHGYVDEQGWYIDESDS